MTNRSRAFCSPAKSWILQTINSSTQQPEQWKLPSPRHFWWVRGLKLLQIWDCWSWKGSSESNRCRLPKGTWDWCSSHDILLHNPPSQGLLPLPTFPPHACPPGILCVPASMCLLHYTSLHIWGGHLIPIPRIFSPELKGSYTIYCSCDPIQRWQSPELKMSVVQTQELTQESREGQRTQSQLIHADFLPRWQHLVAVQDLSASASEGLLCQIVPRALCTRLLDSI